MDFLQIQEKIEQLLQGRSADGYEILLGRSRNLSLEVKEQKIDTFKCSTPMGLSIRVLKGGGMGFSYSTTLEEDSLRRMIDNALIGAETQTPDEHYGFPGPQEYPFLGELFDDALADVGEEEKVSRAMELERGARAFDPRITKVRKATYGESSYEVMIANSLGVQGPTGNLRFQQYRRDRRGRFRFPDGVGFRLQPTICRGRRGPRSLQRRGESGGVAGGAPDSDDALSGGAG